MGKMSIDGLLKAKSDELRDNLGVQLGHPVSKGDLSEQGWTKFLKSFLPSRYDVSRGFVFDSKGNVSDQIDIIIFDPLHSPLIYETDNGEKYITAESVYAVFEVKPQANKKTVEYASNKARSVRELHRTSRPMISSGKPVPARDLTHIIAGLLTTNSISANSLKEHMRSNRDLDIVCSANGGLFYNTGKDIQQSRIDETIFALFYLLLDELFKVGTVPAIDIRKYADLSLASFKLEKEGY